ncbi:MAG: aminopeptidase P family protein [Myxococcales bacterium]|nr:aminopeptidase P family protein [Myxococcales bacterium]
MIPLQRHKQRRQQLAERVSGPILLLGNGTRARNLPMTPLPFRQDSTFLYFTGCERPHAAALLHDGRFTLYLPEPAPDDALWHGHTDDLQALCARYGADEAVPVARLEQDVQSLPLRVLAVPDEARNRWASQLVGHALQFGRDHGDPELADAVIALRRTKDADEIAEMRQAASITEKAFLATMRATQPGSHERGLWTLFEAVLRMHDGVPGYDTILTQSGEVLHNNDHSAPLQDGRLVLLDGGGELMRSGYGVDITRTWPVSGRFEGRQRAAYEAVLESQRVAIAACTVGREYRSVHDAACTVLAQFLVDEGLVRGERDGILERGTHALFFPHGVGHHLGLDVHDLENFGDRPAYPPGVPRPEPFGTRYLRLNLPLEAGWVVTVEPGFYVVPAILQDPELLALHGSALNTDAIDRWQGFGGIRIEDDVLVTETGPDVLTSVPKAADAILEIVGSGPTAEALLCGS